MLINANWGQPLVFFIVFMNICYSKGGEQNSLVIGEIKKKICYENVPLIIDA